MNAEQTERIGTPLPGEARRAPSGLVYLASPYSHDSFIVRSGRAKAAARAAAILCSRGAPVISPIAHGHAVYAASLDLDLGSGWDTWKALDEALIKAAAECLVLMLPGWDASRGIAEELALAGKLDIPVVKLNPASLLGDDYRERFGL